MAQDLTHAVMTVDNCGDWSFFYDFRFSVDFDQAISDTFVVTNHTLHTMALNTEQVGSQKYVLDDVSFFFGETKFLESVHAQFF